MLVALVDMGVARLEHLTVDRARDDVGDLLVRRPDVGEEHVLAVLVLPDRGAGEILGHRALERIRSEEHTSELQSLMRISYAVFCLKKKKITKYRRKHDH